jgi:thiol-disulfide isomerase/thioredoxin
MCRSRRVVDHHETVVIDFEDPWCAPCRGLLPILEQAAESHPDIVVCRVSGGEHKERSRAFE